MTAIFRAVRESTLTANQRLVVMAAASLSNPQTGVIPEQYRPGPDELAGATGLSRATVYRCLSEVDAAGWIRRVQVAGRGCQVVAALIPAQSHTETAQSHTETGTLLHGPYGPKDSSSSEKPTKADPPPRPDVDHICQHLADTIEANGSKRPTITAKWRTEARLLLDRDGRTVDQVIKAIDWCQADPFWKANILSMPTLRAKYDQLRLQAVRNRGSPNGTKPSTTDSRVAAAMALAAKLETKEITAP